MRTIVSNVVTCVHDKRKEIQCSTCSKKFLICDFCKDSHQEYHKQKQLNLDKQQLKIMDSLDMGPIYLYKQYRGLRRFPSVIRKKEEYFAERNIVGNDFPTLKELTFHYVTLKNIMNKIRSKNEKIILNH